VKVEAAGSKFNFTKLFNIFIFKDGGLEQLITSFNSSKTQYGFATVAAGAQRKVVLFHWVEINFLIFLLLVGQRELFSYYTSHH